MIVDGDTRIADLERRIAANKDRVARIEQSQALASAQREAYLKLKEKAARANEELTSWQQNIGPVKHILAVECGHHGMQFATVRDAFDSTRPSSPDPKIVGGLCLAIGAAFGIVVVLLAELLDRSFRTARGISSTLGLPVIESIDEILTAAARKNAC